MQAGALHILRKPVNAHALLETVLEVVARPHRHVSAGRTQDALTSTSDPFGEGSR
ncbi:MAG: hypothetical protein QOE70_1550 [Chthoniobacter sp.]|jgi:FixJ family two-component response regulator|nr:hypothetical protein [Chthoniobacter sp.]